MQCEAQSYVTIVRLNYLYKVVKVGFKVFKYRLVKRRQLPTCLLILIIATIRMRLSTPDIEESTTTTIRLTL